MFVAPLPQHARLSRDITPIVQSGISRQLMLNADDAITQSGQAGGDERIQRFKLKLAECITPAFT
jgi:hypothetical protein